MLKEKINELGDVIRQLVLNGEYKFISCNNRLATILLENEFKVKIWVGNQEHSLTIHRHDLVGDNSIYFESDEDRLKVWEELKPCLKQHVKDELKKAEESHIEQLKRDLKELS